VVVLAGVVVMVVLFVVAVASVTGSDRRSAPPPRLTTPEAVAPTGEGSPSAGPPVEPSSVAPPSSAPARPDPTRPGATARPTPKPARSTQPAPPRPPLPPVTGRYRPVQAGGGSLIADVLITNNSSTPRDWTVQLLYPANVGDVRAIKADVSSPPKVGRDGDLWVFDGASPIAPSSTLTVRLVFDYKDGPGRPVACTVNDEPCQST
jgi:hypothetical protein